MDSEKENNSKPKNQTGSDLTIGTCIIASVLFWIVNIFTGFIVGYILALATPNPIEINLEYVLFISNIITPFASTYVAGKMLNGKGIKTIKINSIIAIIYSTITFLANNFSGYYSGLVIAGNALNIFLFILAYAIYDKQYKQTDLMKPGDVDPRQLTIDHILVEADNSNIVNDNLHASKIPKLIITKSTLAIVILSVSLASSLVYNFYQHINLTDATSKINSTENQVKTLKYTVNNLYDRINKLNTECEEMRPSYWFYENYACVVSDTSDGKYHRYNCSCLDDATGFYIFNIEYAKALGYEPCDICNPPE